jgi:hypothetical protein
MIRSACTAFVVFGLLFLTPTTALAQLGGEYGPAIRGAAIGGVAPYGINDGTGWVFGTVTDDDGDGVIKLPLVPIPGRLAVGVNHTGSSVDPDCLLWDLVGTSAHVGGTSISVPLLIVAEDIEGEALGIDFGELAAPPLALTPGDRLTVTDGILPGWLGIRLVNDSGVPDLETFIAVVDTLPDFNGDVVVSNTVVRFTLVPEPSTFALATLGMLGVACRRRKHT